MLKLSVQQAHQTCKHAKDQGETWSSREAQTCQAQDPSPKAPCLVKGQACKCSKTNAHKGKLSQHGRDLMHGLRQSQAGYQCQEPCIGQSSGVVFAVGLASKRKSHGLSALAFAKGVHRIPASTQTQKAQGHERHANGLGSRKPRRQALYGPGSQPIGKQGVQFRRLTQKRGMPPVAVVKGKFQHEPQGRQVHGLPCLTEPKPWDHVGDAKHIQCDPRQAANRVLTDDGWRRLFQVKCTLVDRSVTKNKGSAENRAALLLALNVSEQCGINKKQLLCCCFTVFVSKALNTSTHVVHRFLCTGVERV